MTEPGDDAEYRRFLDAQPLTTLRDWSLEVARERLDVGFLWDLVRHLPETAEHNRDFAVLDPINAVGELIELVTNFRQDAADPEAAPLLRARYIDYLVDHAGTRRFDHAGSDGR